MPKEDAAAILREVSVLRARRMLRTLAIVQDCADMLLAVNDIKGVCGASAYSRSVLSMLTTHPLCCTDGKGRLNHPILLCVAGLVSGSLSAYKNWQTLVATT